MRYTKEKRFALVMIAVVAVYVAAIVAAHYLMPFDPNHTDISRALRPPGEDGFLLGSDNVGRDVLLRTLSGGTESVLTSFAIVAIAFVAGTLVGVVGGYLGGRTDYVLGKVIVIFQAFPNFVLAIAIAAVLGQGTGNMIMAIVAVYWTQIARLARSLTVSMKESDYVKAARVCGAGPAAVMRKYLLPNLVSPLIVMAMLSVGDVILTMAGLSFLGLGPMRPTNEWGAMMSEARGVFQFAPWNVIVPGVALFIAVIIFNLLGDALRDSFDVRTQQIVDDDERGTGKDGTRYSRKGRKMGKKRYGKGIAAVFAACLVACGLMLGGCSSGGGSTSSGSGAASSGAAAEAQAGGVLRAGSAGYFYAESMDPANNWDGWEMEYYGIAENLMKLTDDFQVEPWLAASVENVDELTWKFTLRDDVKFSNGEKMTGESVKACLERTYKENTRAQETLPMASIEADGQTVTFKTADPVPSFENCICDPIFAIYYTGENVEYAKDTPCTGPYKVAEFVGDPDYKIKMVPNENYWDGAPKLDEVYLSTYFDDDSMNMAMQNGELQLLAMPSSNAYSIMSDESKYQKAEQTSSRADFIRFNMKHEITAEPAIREAISWCIDREGYANTICGGTEVPSYGIFSAQLPYGGTDGLNVTVDSLNTEKAAAVLDEAGIIDTDNDGVREFNGKPAEINLVNCTNYQRFVSLVDDLQSKLAGIGIKLKVKEVDYWLQDSKTYAKDDPDMTIDSYGMAPTGDASYFTNMSFVTDGSANFGGYSNSEVDALAKELGTTFDEAKRTELIKQIEQKVLDDNPYIFFSNSTTNYLASTNLTGFAVAPSEYYLITADTGFIEPEK